MRVGFLIGALNAGGSERQLSVLASGLAGRGHDVEVMSYDGAGVFDDVIIRSGGRVRHGNGGSRLHKLAQVREWLREFRPEVVHGFMKRASGLAVLASLPRRRCKVIASDLSTATYARRQPALWGALALFHLADRVATQTDVNRRSLGLLAPLLRRKIVVIRNGVDTTRFQPAERAAWDRGRPFRFLCVGSVYHVKNPVGVVEAARILRENSRLPFTVTWVGRSSRGSEEVRSEAYLRATDLVRRYGLEGIVEFRGQVSAVEEAYAQADALVHVSIQEGIPNAVVEAMASGLPVVVSRVSDLPSIVQHARNGFVCEARDPGSIAAALQQMMEATDGERKRMGASSRSVAEAWFGNGRFIRDYESLYRELLGR